MPLADRVAKALGLPTTDVRTLQDPQTVADVVVTLGADYANRAGNP